MWALAEPTCCNRQKQINNYEHYYKTNKVIKKNIKFNVSLN